MGIGQLLKDQLSLTLNLPTRLLLCRSSLGLPILSVLHQPLTLYPHISKTSRHGDPRKHQGIQRLWDHTIPESSFQGLGHTLEIESALLGTPGLRWLGIISEQNLGLPPEFSSADTEKNSPPHLFITDAGSQSTQ